MLFNEPKLLKFATSIVASSRERGVSVLFNEPKLLKFRAAAAIAGAGAGFSALQRAEIAEMWTVGATRTQPYSVSVLFNEPKLLKSE